MQPTTFYTLKIMIPQFEWYWTVSVYEYICIVFALAVNVNKKWECRAMFIVSSVSHQHTQLVCDLNSPSHGLLKFEISQ